MIRAKIDILKALKDKGYNTNYLRVNNILSQSILTKIRTGDLTGISLKTLNVICGLLRKQPGQLIEYTPDPSQDHENTK